MDSKTEIIEKCKKKVENFFINNATEIEKDSPRGPMLMVSKRGVDIFLKMVDWTQNE